MAGQVLLSGWRVRLGDGNNQPLFPGRISFYDSTTDDAKSVYEGYKSEIPLGTSVECDSEGYLPAIWLDYGLYKCVTEVKTSVVPEIWEPLYTLNHVGSTLPEPGAPGTGKLAYCTNIAEMKAVEAGTVDAFIVAGYDEAGDCGDPLFFDYDPSSTENDDGGAFIRANNTPALSPGRCVQVFHDKDNIDVRAFGGLPDGVTDCIGPIVNCQTYCSRTDIFSKAPTICFGGSNKSFYNISGPVVLDGTCGGDKINYKIDHGAVFGYGSVAASVTFSNPVEILSRTNLGELALPIHFEQGSSSFIRPEWFNEPSYAEKLGPASEFGIPVWVDYTGDFQWATATGDVTVNSDMVVFPGTRIAPTAGKTITINGKIESLTADDPIFCAQDILGTVTVCEGSVLISHDADVRVSWFGYGHIVGDQAPAVQKAWDSYVFEEDVNTGPVFVFPEVSSSLLISTTITSNLIHKVRCEGLVRVNNGATLNQVSLTDTSATYKFDCELGSFVHIKNAYILPEWFGMGHVVATRQAEKMTVAIECASLSSVPLDGRGKDWTMSETVAPTNYAGPLMIRNLGLKSSSSSLADYVLSLDSGNYDLVLDNVNIQTTGDSAATAKSVSLSAYRLVVNRCSLQNESWVSGGNVSFTGNQCYGRTSLVDNKTFFYVHFDATQVEGFNIYGNTFNHSNVQVVGSTAVIGSNSFAMLSNTIITNNNFITDGTAGSGCLNIVANVNNTLISGLVVKDNVFSGQIASANDSAGKLLRRRITNSLEPGASWVNRDTSSAASPYYKIRHSLVVKDNRYAMDQDAELGTDTAFNQYTPSTEGSVPWDQALNLSGGTTWLFDPVIDESNMFLLEGDTYSKFDYYRLISPLCIYVSAETLNPLVIGLAVPNYPTIGELSTNTYDAVVVNSLAAVPWHFYATILFKIYDNQILS